MYNIFVWKIEKLLNTIFQRMFIFHFLLFCFFSLSNNTLHVMFYTYICYWNRIQYKYIIQITFYLVHPWFQRKQSKSNLGKVNKKVKTERKSTNELTFSLLFMSFNVPPYLLPKTTNKLLLCNLYHFMYDIQIMSAHRSAL